MKLTLEVFLMNINVEESTYYTFWIKIEKCEMLYWYVHNTYMETS